MKEKNVSQDYGQNGQINFVLESNTILVYWTQIWTLAVATRNTFKILVQHLKSTAQYHIVILHGVTITLIAVTVKK